MDNGIDFLCRVMQEWGNGDWDKDKHLYLTREEVIEVDGAERDCVRQAYMFLCYKRKATNTLVLH